MFTRLDLEAEMRQAIVLAREFVNNPKDGANLMKIFHHKLNKQVEIFRKSNTKTNKNKLLLLKVLSDVTAKQFTCSSIIENLWNVENVEIYEEHYNAYQNDYESTRDPTQPLGIDDFDHIASVAHELLTYDCNAACLVYLALLVDELTKIDVP